MTIVLVAAVCGATYLPLSFATDLTLNVAFGQVASGATLSVLAPSVEVAVGGTNFGAARDGMTLHPGDQVRTKDAGVALLTFFDGSETQLTPDTEISIQQAQSANGPQITVAQFAGTTVDRVQRLASTPGTFSTETPAGAALVRGTRYTVTAKCYATPPAPPAQRLLTFPRRLSGGPYLLAGEAVYNDNGITWEDRAWQDASTGSTFDTYDQIGPSYPEIDETVYQEDDGSFWVDRKWQDSSTGATWDTYENVGVPVDDQTAASLPTVHMLESPIVVAQAQAPCHPVMSVVVIVGIVGMQPKSAGLTQFNVTPGNAGAVSDQATAASPLTTQGLQSFDQATSNLRDVNAARSAGQLATNVSDEFAAVVVPPPAGSPGGPGGPSGPGATGGFGGLLGGPTASGLLAARQITSASSASGLLAFVNPLPIDVAGVQTTNPQTVAQNTGATNGGQSAAQNNPSAPPPPPPGPGGPSVGVAAAQPVAAASSSTHSGGGAGPPAAVAPNPDVASAVIGPGGGSIGLSDGSASVTLPPNAVSGDTTIQIARTSAPATSNGQQVVSTTVDLTANGANGATLNAPAQVTLAFSSAPAGVFFFNTTTSTWQAVDGGSSVNQSTNTVTGTTSHFTIFAALTAPTTPTPTPTRTATPTATPSPSPTPTSTNTPVPVGGCTVSWVGPQVGDWQNSANWSTGGLPSQIDTVCLPGGVTAILSNGSSSISTLSSQGTLDISGGTMTIAGSSSTAGLNLSAGTLNVSNSLTAATATQSGGVLTGAGSLSVNSNGTDTWTGGSIDDTGGGSTSTGVSTALFIDQGAQLILSGTNDRLLTNRQITNQGSVVWRDGGRLLAGGTVGAAILNSGSIDFQADTDIASNGGAPVLANSSGATITKTGTSGGVSLIGIALSNGGTITANVGQLNFGDVNNSGQLTPDSVPGRAPDVVSVQGHYGQDANGTLTLDISGANCSNSDRLTVASLNGNSNATLGGTLVVNTTGGCTSPTEQYVLVSAGTIAGAFANVQLPAGYVLQQTATEVDIVPCTLNRTCGFLRPGGP